MPPTHKKPQKIKNYVETFIDFVSLNKYNKIYIFGLYFSFADRRCGMKNVLIVSHCMELGGAERALLGLLNVFDYEEYNVELFLLRHTGELMRYIPKKVKLLPENKKYSSLAVPLAEVIKKAAFGVALGRLEGKKKAAEFAAEHNFKSSEYVFIEYSHKYTVRHMPMISEKEYDLVISFLTPHYFAAEKTKAKKKIAWIHTDYSFIEIDIESELKMWSAYDKLIAVSESGKEAFAKTFPSLEDRVEVIENIHPAESIKAQAEEFGVTDEMPDDGFVKLLSVGRFCDAKNFDNVPEICSMLDNVKWYIIGYGADETLIKRKIDEFGMRDRVILLGKKTNPYPYFKACDFYVQPSRYEGNAVTVNEALILGKPVAVTNYATAASQINNGVDGVIVPLENKKCAEGLTNFIKDKELQKRIIENINHTDFSKSAEIKKLYKFI